MKVTELRQVKSLILPFGWAGRRVYGGPWADRPALIQGVKLAPEMMGEAQWFLPIRDFSIPLNSMATDRIVREVLLALMVNPREPVYVGCRGGLGRTGLFLSLLAKSLGVQNPVEYVRRHYDHYAVETGEQAQFVQDYEPPFLPLTLWMLKAGALFHGLNPTADTVGG